MSPPPRKLRSVLAMITVTVTLLSLLAAGAFVLLTTVLHRTTTTVGASVERVYLLERAELDLLLHARSRDELVQRHLEDSVRDKLVAARDLHGSPGELRLIDEALASTERYFSGTRQPAASPQHLAALTQAYEQLDEVVELNLASSRENRQDADRWNTIGRVLGIGFAAALVIATAVVLLWLKRRAFRPVFSLAAAMQRFGRGDRDARARESGPAELREMSARFNEMADALAAQRQSQMAFLAGVAHDLRGPLSALKTSVEILGRANPGPGASRRVLDIALRQIMGLERMVGDFLDMAKIEAGQLDVQLQREDLRTLVREVVGLMEDRSSQDRLVLKLPPEPVFARCDVMRMEQVVTNLISNALKYSPAHEPVDIELVVDGGDAVLCVKDRGAGISEEDQRIVFEPFRRSARTTATVPGLGLGLFVVQRIVDAHGGHIEVKSAPGRGSTFKVRFPLVTAEAAVEDPRMPTSPSVH
jgi:signal transduction histidine kinase